MEKEVTSAVHRTLHLQRLGALFRAQVRLEWLMEMHQSGRNGRFLQSAWHELGSAAADQEIRLWGRGDDPNEVG